MNHQDHVELLRRGVPAPDGVWADLGSGDGAFTLALRELLGPQATLYSVDQDRGRLEAQRRAFRSMFPDAPPHFIAADLTRPLDLPPLDGLVMANVLHFFRDKDTLLRRLVAHLKPGGRFILVEYNVDTGNPWVPYPLSLDTYARLAPRCGLTPPERLGARPSRFLREIYSALSFRVVMGTTQG